MIARLWALQITLDKKTYSDVPNGLKEAVKDLLIDSGCEDLVTE